MDARIHAAPFDRERIESFGELRNHVLPVFELHAAALERIVVFPGLFRKLTEIGVNLCNARRVFRNARANLLHAALLLGNILQHTRLGGLTALRICPQHRRLGLAGGRCALHRAQSLSRLLAFNVLPVHSLSDAA